MVEEEMGWYSNIFERVMIDFESQMWTTNTTIDKEWQTFFAALGWAARVFLEPEIKQLWFGLIKLRMMRDRYASPAGRQEELEKRWQPRWLIWMLTPWMTEQDKLVPADEWIKSFPASLDVHATDAHLVGMRELQLAAIMQQVAPVLAAMENKRQLPAPAPIQAPTTKASADKALDPSTLTIEDDLFVDEEEDEEARLKKLDEIGLVELLTTTKSSKQQALKQDRLNKMQQVSNMFRLVCHPGGKN
jgi:hypothetical protein